jgi:hypothetical protein
MSLRDLLYASSRRPSVTLRLAGRIALDVLRVRAAIAYGTDGIGSGTVVLRSPPVTPEQGQAITWTWGYNGQEIPGFTGFVVDVQKASYPDTWELGVRDVLWLASREQRAIATVPLNSITANDAIVYILTTYAGLTRISLPTITRPSGGTWTLGIQTPVSWARTTALAACQQICKDAGFALYADAGGTVRATQIERRPTDSPVWTFLDGRDFLEDATPTRRRDGSSVRNRITVRGADTGVGGAQLFDTFLAPHALYPGVVASDEYRSELLEDIADVTAVAERITGLLNRKPDVVTFGALFNPFLALAQTIGVRDPFVGLSSTRPYFVYSLDSEIDLERGRGRQTIVADGGLGDSGYSLIPPPVAVILVTKLVAETLNGTPVVEVFLDGSGSVSNSEGEIVNWAWATSTTTYGGTPTTASGARAMFVYPGATATAEITLTVTDTSSKTDTAALSLNLAGDATSPLSRAVISLALGAAWAVSPDGGATWNVEATGDATLVPESGPLLATRATGSTGLRGTEDALASASVTLAALGGTITALSSTPGTTRTWAAVGVNLYRSTDSGATFSLWGTLPASITAILEDPAVENSVFVLAGANLYQSAITVTPGTNWFVLYAGPAGATARHLVRGASGATTWIAYTGTFIGSPLHRVEGPVTAVFPVLVPPVSEIRAIALNPDEATVYAWDSDGQAWAVSSDTGIASAAPGGTLLVSETAQHALHDPEVDLVYLATFGTAEGTTYKYLPLIDTLLSFYTPSAGRQAHRVGIGTPPTETGTEVLLLTLGASPGGVWRWTESGGWTLRNSGLPSGWTWRQIATNPTNPNDWLVRGDNGTVPIVDGSVYTAGGLPVLYRTLDAGATWTAVALNVDAGLPRTALSGVPQIIGYDSTGGLWLLGSTSGAYGGSAADTHLWRGTSAGMTIVASDFFGGTNRSRAPLGATAGRGGDVVFALTRGSSGGGRHIATHALGDASFTLTQVANDSRYERPEALDTTSRRIISQGFGLPDYRSPLTTATLGVVAGMRGANGSAWYFASPNVLRIDSPTTSPGAPATAYTAPANALYALDSDPQTRTALATINAATTPNPPTSVRVAYTLDGAAWHAFDGPTGATPINRDVIAIIVRTP